MNKHAGLLLLLAGASLLGGCARQSTPSMMNTSRPQVVSETTMQQMPVKNVGNGYLAKVAEDYTRYGSDTVQLSLAYDPNSKTYGAVQAFKDLAKYKDTLGKYGVRGVSAETVKAEGSEPTLMITYDAVKAQAPAGCRNMPGFDDGLTTAQIGDYKFGCSVDAMLAKQIYHPADLQGNDASDPIDGRRASNVVDYYKQVTPEEADAPLTRMGRDDIQQ